MVYGPTQTLPRDAGLPHCRSQAPGAEGPPWHADAKILMALRQAPLLSSLSDEAIRALAASTILRRYGKGQTIFCQGDAGTHLYAMADGMVKLVRISAEGNELILGVRRPGDIFGEVSLFDNLERAAQAEAVRPSTLLLIPKRAAFQLLTDHPELAERLLEQMGLLIREAIERAFDFVYLDLKGRMAKMLVYLFEMEDRETMRLELHQGELASVVGGSRPAVNQILRDFERRGYLHRDGRLLVVDQPEALMQRASIS